MPLSDIQILSSIKNMKDLNILLPTLIHFILITIDTSKLYMDDIKFIFLEMKPIIKSHGVDQLITTISTIFYTITNMLTQSSVDIIHDIGLSSSHETYNIVKLYTIDELIDYNISTKR